MGQIHQINPVHSTIIGNLTNLHPQAIIKSKSSNFDQDSEPDIILEKEPPQAFFVFGMRQSILGAIIRAMNEKIPEQEPSQSDYLESSAREPIIGVPELPRLPTNVGADSAVNSSRHAPTLLLFTIHTFSLVVGLLVIAVLIFGNLAEKANPGSSLGIIAFFPLFIITPFALAAGGICGILAANRSKKVTTKLYAGITGSAMILTLIMLFWPHSCSESFLQCVSIPQLF